MAALEGSEALEILTNNSIKLRLQQAGFNIDELFLVGIGTPPPAEFSTSAPMVKFTIKGFVQQAAEVVEGKCWLIFCSMGTLFFWNLYIEA